MYYIPTNLNMLIQLIIHFHAFDMSFSGMSESARWFELPKKKSKFLFAIRTHSTIEFFLLNFN